MMIRFYLHSATKRAETTALLDSGATENFMDLMYTQWAKLPIKRMKDPQKLYNVDGTENKQVKSNFSWT